MQKNIYDFAFSFAGEDREIVEPIRTYLVEHNYTVFYDKDYQHNLVGKDLYSYLREVYREKCKFVVCFISLNYTKKEWTNLELTAIKERFISTFFAADFLIPILIGKPWRIEDIPSYIGFYSYQTPSETAKMLINKFENSLIEDNYLFNISNCIEYICEKTVDVLKKSFDDVNLKENTILIKQFQEDYQFKFSPEENLNIQSILVFYKETPYPELLITWRRTDLLLFDIVYFSIIKPISENLSITDLIDEISNFIKNRLEF